MIGWRKGSREGGSTKAVYKGAPDRSERSSRIGGLAWHGKRTGWKPIMEYTVADILSNEEDEIKELLEQVTGDKEGTSQKSFMETKTMEDN